MSKPKKSSGALGKGKKIKEVKAKKTRQGSSKNTKYANTPSNKARKKYRGQGR
jgi:hypothetical protein